MNGTLKEQICKGYFMKTPYEKDFYQWSVDQANYLRMGELGKLDIEHLIEEIETLGNSDKRAMVSYLTNYFMHLLKIQFQPEKHTSSWDISVSLSLRKFKRLLKQNPSFKRFLKEWVNDAYEDAKDEASKESGINKKVFPKKCPWTIEEILNENK